MPRNHYVPQFYLRYFSNNGKSETVGISEEHVKEVKKFYSYGSLSRDIEVVLRGKDFKGFRIRR